ncbi:MAG: high frequency lysogenization protein HflD [Gammaproteobacteria bacterium]|nr:high frequency lysogenization protein HflD [Gammaproteobacteria bacterium]
MKLLDDRVIALAGILQAAHLVNRVAQRGMADQAALEASLGSVLRLDADSTADVFGGRHGVETGLRQIERQIGREREPLEQRYVINLLQLAPRLQARPDLVERIRTGVRQAQALADERPLTDPEVVACLADTYTETVSTLSPRIMVTGEPTLLNRPEVANRIRALLLAGVRAAVLWNQCGGSRLKLLFQARRTVERARAMLADIGRRTP